MRLSFNEHGDIYTDSNSKIESINEARGELGRFLFYSGVKKGGYDYATSFGNNIYLLIGATNRENSITNLKKIVETDMLMSSLFENVDSQVQVTHLGRHKLGVHITGRGITASWEVLQSGRGTSLLSFNEGSTSSSSSPVITEKVFKDFDINKVNFDITSAYKKTMEKNNITTLGEVTFNLRVLYLADNTTEARIMRDYEYQLSEGLESRDVQFHRPFGTSGTLTFQVWPSTSEIHSTDNQYLLRKKRSSNPTTVKNTY